MVEQRRKLEKMNKESRYIISFLIGIDKYLSLLFFCNKYKYIKNILNLFEIYYFTA